MKIGFIGLGIMGEAMCGNIIRKHPDQVLIYDIDQDKAEKLYHMAVEEGRSNVRVCKDHRELAAASDMIISMVPKSEHARSVYETILPELNADKVCIDMSTIDPSVSVEISRMVKQTGADFADAPVVKSRPAAEKGALGIYVGCEEGTFDKILPVLSYMGENIIRMGDNGNGLVMKICHNALVSQIQNGVNETASLAKAAGIDVLTFAKAISYGGGQNFYLDSKKNVIEQEDFKAAFSIENMHKDVHIALNLAEEYGVYMPGEENAVRVYDQAMEKGYGKEDFSATIKVVREGKKA
ncbi:MAG: NAD(P)-dependent oxidoreductase [Firmicutes bacterium]|nr:NAD(P)-dependent oxidoreductase [Bacillota bacterium]